MEQNGFIFHDQPKKDTGFLLCGEKAGSKKIKAESLGIKIYDSRDEAIRTFPFLANIRENKKDKKDKSNANQMSLF